ncbi:hypothetical protein GCM10009700_14230 [Brevibacterium sanguinis]
MRVRAEVSRGGILLKQGTPQEGGRRPAVDSTVLFKFALCALLCIGPLSELVARCRSGPLLRVGAALLRKAAVPRCPAEPRLRAVLQCVAAPSRRASTPRGHFVAPRSCNSALLR